MKLWEALVFLVELACAGCIGTHDPCWAYS
jgi:hypothetical protein